MDKRAPSITLTQRATATYLLNQVVAASYSCSDAAIDTSSAGTKTFTVKATDNVGNTISQSVSYTVNYAFSGFLVPVNNPSTVNTGKAGRAYPVKFQLTDASGAFSSSLSAVKLITYRSTSCGAFSTDPTDPLETSTTGNSGLRYDSTANQFVYTWATPPAGCYTLFLTLDSGQAASIPVTPVHRRSIRHVCRRDRDPLLPVRRGGDQLPASGPPGRLPDL